MAQALTQDQFGLSLRRQHPPCTVQHFIATRMPCESNGSHLRGHFTKRGLRKAASKHTFRSRMQKFAQHRIQKKDWQSIY